MSESVAPSSAAALSAALPPAYLAGLNDTIDPGRPYEVNRDNSTTLPYDYQSIMHYRICWASKCEDECKDGIGNTNFGQQSAKRIRLDVAVRAPVSRTRA